MTRSIALVVLSFFGCLAHILLSVPLEIVSAKIDFLMITVIMLAMFTRLWYPPVLCALFGGLMTDLSTQAGTFVNTGVYLGFAAVIGLAFSLFKEKGFLLSGITAACAVAFKHLLFAFLLYMMQLSETLTLATFWHGVPSAIYTGVIAIGIYFLYHRLFQLPFMQLKTGEEERIFIEKN